jgi:hypothetical protein
MTAVAAIGGSLLLQLAALLFLVGFLASPISPMSPLYFFIGIVVVVAAAGVFTRARSRPVLLIAALTGYALGLLALSEFVNGSVLPAAALVVYALLATDAGALLTFGALRLTREHASG